MAGIASILLESPKKSKAKKKQKYVWDFLHFVGESLNEVHNIKSNLSLGHFDHPPFFELGSRSSLFFSPMSLSLTFDCRLTDTP